MPDHILGAKPLRDNDTADSPHQTVFACIESARLRRVNAPQTPAWSFDQCRGARIATRGASGLFRIAKVPGLSCGFVHAYMNDTYRLHFWLQILQRERRGFAMASTPDTFDYQNAADDALQAWGEYSRSDSGPTRNPVTLHELKVKMTYSKIGSDGLPKGYHWDWIAGNVPPSVTSVLSHKRIVFFTDIVLASPLNPGGPGIDRPDSTVVGTFILTSSVSQGSQPGEPGWRVLVEQSKENKQLHYLSGHPFSICGHANQEQSDTTQDSVVLFDSTLPSWSGDPIPFSWAKYQNVIVPAGVTFDGEPGSLAAPVVLRYSPNVTTDEQGKFTRECGVLAFCVSTDEAEASGSRAGRGEAENAPTTIGEAARMLSSSLTWSFTG